MVRALALLLSGNLLNASLMMARTLLLASLLSLYDYGVASTFVLAVAIVEMMSTLGLQARMLQFKNGNDPSFQAALQGFQAMRGVFNGLILFLLATPLANFFGAPEISWAYQAIALVPVLQGFMHFDLQRHERQLKYIPAFINLTVPVLVSIIMIWPLFLIFGDYRVLLFAILVQYFVMLLFSHMMAERPYRLTLDRVVIVDSFHFGWPVMLNGALMFAIFNGERMIIGRELGLEALAVFSMAVSLTLPIALVMSRSAVSFFLPQISGARGTARHPVLASVVFQAHFVAGSILLLSVALFGGPFIYAVLGEKYADAIPLLAWLAIMQSIRVWKGGSSVVATAAGHTENAMVANSIRVAFLPIAWIAVAQGYSLLMVIWVGIAGELIGFFVGLTLALTRQGLGVRSIILPILSGLVLQSLAGVHAYMQNDWMPDLRTSAGLVVVFVFSTLTMSDLIRYLRNRVIHGH